MNRSRRLAVNVLLLLLFVGPVAAILGPTGASFQCTNCARKHQGDCTCGSACATKGGCQGCCQGQLEATQADNSWWMWFTDIPEAQEEAFNACLQNC
jgi:hypothetical protein